MPPAPDAAPRAVRPLAAAAAVAYSSWVLAPLLGSPLDPLHSYASELAATDQAGSWVYRCADLVAAGLLLALGVLLTRRARTGPWWRDLRTGGLALVAMAVLTVGDTMLPLSCAATADPVCAAAERTGAVPLSHQLHLVTSLLAGTAMVVAAAVITLALVPTRAARRPAGAVLCALALAIPVCSALTLVAADESVLIGLAQRSQLAAFAIWLVLVGVLLGDPHSHDPRRQT